MFTGIIKKNGILEGNTLQKLIQQALIFYLPSELLKTSILIIFSKELSSSIIFSREEFFKIKNRKIRKINTGIKVTIEKLS